MKRTKELSEMDGRSAKGIWKPILTNSKKIEKDLTRTFK
jgi:hypothetical protein